jgi:hypothetical protein
MSDLVLEIAPGYTVRGLLAADQTDPVYAGFSIFEFLDTIARRHKPNAKPGGGFSQAYWQRAANDPLLVDMPVSYANLLAPSGRRRHPFLVTTAAGLLQLLTFVQIRLPNAKPLPHPQPKPPVERSEPFTQQEINEIFADPVRRADFLAKLEEHNNPQPKPKQKINAELNATVADTLERFIAGHRSMLCVIANTITNNTSTPQTISKHEQNATALHHPQASISNDVSPRDVYFRCMDHVVMGTHHPGIDEPVFSVYSTIEITRNHGGIEQRFYYTRRMWEVITKKYPLYEREAVQASIRYSLFSTKRIMTPAVPMSKIYFLFNFIRNYAYDRSLDAFNNKRSRGMKKNGTYEPLSTEVVTAFLGLLGKYTKGDTSMIHKLYST